MRRNPFDASKLRTKLAGLFGGFDLLPPLPIGRSSSSALKLCIERRLRVCFLLGLHIHDYTIIVSALYGSSLFEQKGLVYSKNPTTTDRWAASVTFGARAQRKRTAGEQN